MSVYLQVNDDLSDAAQHSDEVKNVPSIPKIVLCGKKREFKPFFSFKKKGVSNSGPVLSSLTRRPKAMILRMHSTEKITVKAVFRCFRTASYAGGAE